MLKKCIHGILLRRNETILKYYLNEGKSLRATNANCNGNIDNKT